MKLSKIQKFLRSNYLCVVNPQKRKVFDFKKGKHLKYKRHAYSDKSGLICNAMPLCGYMCPVCDIANSDSKHFHVDGVCMCEACAIKVIKYKT